MRVLVIDQSGMSHNFYARSLLVGDLDVIYSTSMSDALQKLEDSTPVFDLVIVDIDTPALEEYEFLDQYRGMDTHQLPVVMVSKKSSAHMSQAYSGGVNLFIEKPVEATYLLNVINVISGRRKV